MNAQSHTQSWSQRIALAGAALKGRAPEDDQDDSDEFLPRPYPSKVQKIVDFLDQVDLEPTPENYSFAWEYHFGESHDLRREVDKRLASLRFIPPQEVEQLTAKYLTVMTANKLASMVATSDNLMKEGREVIRRSHHHSKEYGSALQDQIEEIEANGDQAMDLSSLLSLTRDMAIRATEAQRDLQEASKQLVSLRQDLASATDRAETDQLTGLPNRWAFEKHFNEALDRAKHSYEPLSVAFVDVDHFKKINDTHGHDTGDRVLRRIGTLLDKMNGSHCHVARHGGEEFVLLFTDTTAKGAFEKVDGVRQELAGHNFVNQETNQEIGKITFSAGIAALDGDGDGRKMLRVADEALYKAKESGRNQCLIASD